MTDDSQFVIRWEIDNAATTLATGKAESRVFDHGGFKWTATIDRIGDNALISLQCGKDNIAHWKCEANVQVRVMVDNQGHLNSIYSKCHFVEKIGKWLFISSRRWNSFSNPNHHCNGKYIFEFKVEIINSERNVPIVILTKFDEPNHMSNVILKIGEKKLHVSKELLAIHSPVFSAMFFGEFAEKGKDEVEMKEVLYEELVDFLQLIYHRNFEITLTQLIHPFITDRTVPHILKLADRFQIESIIEQSEKYLIESRGIDVVRKLLLADQYNLSSLKNHCLNTFTSANALTVKLKSSNEFDNFSDGLQLAICRRIFDLTPLN